MLKHLVAGVDFPFDCDKYCRELADLKPLLGLEELTLVHVLGGSYPQIPASTHQQDYLEKLETYAEIIRKKLDLKKVSSQVEVGLPASELNRIAREVKADGITLLFQNHSKVHEFFLGSIALDMARSTDFPLLLLTKQPEPVSHTLALATDGSDAAKPAEQLFKQLLPATDKAILLNVETYKDKPEHQQAIKQLYTGYQDNSQVELIHAQGEPIEEILQSCHYHAVDLLIMGKRGQNPLKGLLLGSTTERLCRKIKRPVLIVPEPQ